MELYRVTEIEGQSVSQSGRSARLCVRWCCADYEAR